MFDGKTTNARKREEEEEDDDNDKHDEDNKEDEKRETGQRRRLHERDEPTTLPASTTSSTPTTTPDTAMTATCETTASSDFASATVAAAQQKEAQGYDEDGRNDKEEEDEEKDDGQEEEDDDVSLDPAAKLWKSTVHANLENLARNVRHLSVIINAYMLIAGPFPKASHEEMMNDDVVLIGEAMERSNNNRTVKELHLERLKLDERAALAIARGIRHQPNLRSVHLIDVCLPEEWSSSSSEEEDESSSSEEEEDESSSSSEEEEDTQDHRKVFSESIASLKSIFELSIRHMGRWRYWIMIVSDVLVNSTSLKRLKLCSNPYSNFETENRAVATILLRAMSNNTSLKWLMLSSFCIDCDDVARMVESFRGMAKLQEVDFDLNEIGPEGLRILMRAMAQHPTWRRLSFSRNEGIGFEGLTIAGEELQQMMNQQDQNNTSSNRIKWIKLDLSYCVHSSFANHLDDDDSDDDSDDGDSDDGGSDDDEPKAGKSQQVMARGRAEQALLNSVKDNVYIRELLLDEDYLTEDSLDMIALYVQLNKMGRYLLGMDHGLAPTIWCHVLAKCNAPDSYRRRPRSSTYHRSVMYFFLREQPDLIRQPSQVGAATTTTTTTLL